MAKALILTGGISKRMQPVSDKNLIKFFGKELVLWQAEFLIKNGIKDLIVVTSPFNEKAIKDIFEKSKITNVQFAIQSDLNLGMCGALLAAESLLDKELLIFSGNDNVESFGLKLMIEAAENGDFDGYILGKKVKSYFPGGYLKTDEEGLISGIVEKPLPGTEPSDLVNLVLHFHKDAKKLIEYLKTAKSTTDDLYELALDNMVKDGFRMKAVEYDGKWQPVKFPWHVHPVFNMLMEREFGNEQTIHPTAQISDRAILKGKVVVEAGAKIMENAIVVGPAYIGKNAIVANNALVRDSHIGESSVVGFGTEVARSFLGANVWTHSNYIGDSLIGNNVSFGAGAVTGNLRLDEMNINVNVKDQKVDSGQNKLGIITGDHVRVGVNTSFMPGVKIGSNSVVGPGIVVYEDVPENSFYRGETVAKISPNKLNIEDLLRG